MLPQNFTVQCIQRNHYFVYILRYQDDITFYKQSFNINKTNDGKFITSCLKKNYCNIFAFNVSSYFI